MPRRWLLLADCGALLVSTDLHGNGRDFRALRDLFLALPPDAHWAVLGDAVHAPSPDARRRRPDLYDFADGSLTIVEGILALQERCPGRVHYVLGNHDFGHVGGPPTGKFYPDEVAHLEATVGPAGVASLRRLFEPALLCVVAPCGVLLAHGSPGDGLRDLADLDAVTFPDRDPYRRGLLDSFLTSYGQREEVCDRLLATASRGCGVELRLVVHGHDRDEAGYFAEGGNQACPVLFGAPRENKRYLLLDLAARYRGVADLRDGVELRRLHAG
jgi:hypothetical protein